jgi:hypothetical protein
MMNRKQRHEEETLLFNNDTEKVCELKDDQGFAFRMNINSRVSSNLHSSLENIYNTIKDLPDIDLIQHDDHMYGSYPPVENETFSFKDEVLSALTIMRDFEDEVIEKSMHEYRKEKPTNKKEEDNE